MAASNPSLRSFGQLAEVLQKSSDWPADIDLKPRSLSTLLSKLDHRQDLSWLAERPSVQRALARVLGSSPDTLRQLVGANEAAALPTRLLRWRDLPAARPLDLLTEALPPGLPDAAQLIAGEPLWWLAPSGAGRSLMGCWLAARGRATHTLVDSSSLPLVAGPVFLECASRASLERLPAARPEMCVAAPYLPPLGSSYRVLAAPTLADSLPRLLNWAAERLPKDSRLRPEPAAAWLQEQLALGVVNSFGGVLGLIGLIDELGLRELSTRPLERQARRYLERRVAGVLDPAAPHAVWLRRALHGAVLGMFERCLADSDVPLEGARSFDEWLGLVPAEVERSVDVEWMRLSLAGISSTIRTSDLERAAERLPPGAFRIVTSLEQAGFLRRSSDERLQLEPVWWRAVMHQQVVTGLLERSPFEWGEALLRPHAAPLIAQALFARTRQLGGSALEPVLDLEAEDQPAYAVAVDLALRCAGIARLLGHDISSEILEGLWLETERLLLDLGTGLPEPRIELSAGAAEESSPHSGTGAALLERGTFYLAALSVSEALSESTSSRWPVLNPWHETALPASLGEAYDAILATLQRQPAWTREAFLLIDRLRRSIGNAGHPEVPHPLEKPAQILDEIQHGVLAWATLGLEQNDPRWLDALFALAEERDVGVAEVSRAIWLCWDESGRPQGAHFLAPDAPQHPAFWRHIPGPLLEKLLVDARRRAVPFAVFGDEQWEAFRRAVPRYPELMAEREAWVSMPMPLALTLLGSELEWQSAPEAVGVLWERFPHVLQAALRRQLDAGPRADTESLQALLAGAPAAQISALVQELGKAGSAQKLAASALIPVRFALHRAIRERGNDWREAYRVLSALERELRRVSQRSGYAPTP